MYQPCSEFQSSSHHTPGLSKPENGKNEFKFSNNDNLGLIEGFHNLDTINGSLNFRENHTLHNISGFEKLVSADNITIKNNQKMVQVEGFVSFKNGKSLSISDNSSLKV
ncbi:MAG: hypothetical protein IPK25_05610 [Saprospiraceae bacterium]|nr:hypothetical protein [Saprospiraceae bacterium]